MANFTLAFVPLLFATHAMAADSLDEALALETKGNLAEAQSQARIDKIADETDSLAGQFRIVIEELDGLRTYNRQLDRLVAGQAQELDSLRDQIKNVTVIARQVTPLMLRMLDRLEEFIELDIPLHLSERRERIVRLRDMMDRADVTNAEKYRRIIEAYQIENDYGRTVEAYQETMNIAGEERTLNFLSFGRVALVYQTLDGNEASYWDQARRSWIELPDRHRSAIRKGLRIARKQAAPDLVRLPVAAPITVSGGAAQ